MPEGARDAVRARASLSAGVEFSEPARVDRACPLRSRSTRKRRRPRRRSRGEGRSSLSRTSQVLTLCETGRSGSFGSGSLPSSKTRTSGPSVFSKPCCVRVSSIRGGEMASPVCRMRPVPPGRTSVRWSAGSGLPPPTRSGQERHTRPMPHRARGWTSRRAASSTRTSEGGTCTHRSDSRSTASSVRGPSARLAGSASRRRSVGTGRYGEEEERVARGAVRPCRGRRCAVLPAGGSRRVRRPARSGGSAGRTGSPRASPPVLRRLRPLCRGPPRWCSPAPRSACGTSSRSRTSAPTSRCGKPTAPDERSGPLQVEMHPELGLL